MGYKKTKIEKLNGHHVNLHEKDQKINADAYLCINNKEYRLDYSNECISVRNITIDKDFYKEIEKLHKELTKIKEL